MNCGGNRGEIDPRDGSAMLGNAVCIKVSDRDTRDIIDIFAMLEFVFLKKAFADPAAELQCHNGRRTHGRSPQPRSRHAVGLAPVHA
jgi:hypothetical protein